VTTNYWVWKPPDHVEAKMEAQLDAIWDELGAKTEAFRRLPPGARVALEIEIYHHGPELRLGWTLAQRHVVMAAAFNASLSVDEYDYTSGA